MAINGRPWRQEGGGPISAVVKEGEGEGGDCSFGTLPTAAANICVPHPNQPNLCSRGGERRGEGELRHGDKMDGMDDV